MANEATYGVRFTGDGTALAATTRASKEELNQVGASARAAATDLQRLVQAQQDIAEKIASITKAANDADFESMGERIGRAVGEGVGTGMAAAQGVFNQFEEWAKAKSIAISVGIGVVLAGTLAGAVYTAYKAVTAAASFTVGLFTGESYKSEAIDALLKRKADMQGLQESLQLTSQQAQATGAALRALGVDQSDYVSTLQAVIPAVRTNYEELDRLGVKYEDARGAVLDYRDVLQNTKSVLDQYTAGYDRNQAAASIGMGTYKQITETLRVTSAATKEAYDRQAEYGLVIGVFADSEAKRYQDAIRDFNLELQNTSDGFQKAIADNILPVLTDLAEFFKDGFPVAVRAFRYTMAEITSLFYGLKTVVYTVAEAVLASVESMTGGIVTLVSAGAKAATGDWSGAMDELSSGADRFKSRWKEAFDNVTAQATANRDKMALAWGFDDPSNAPAKRGKTWVPKPEENNQESAFDRMITTLERERAKLLAETDSLSRGINPAENARSAETQANLKFDPRLQDITEQQRQRALALAQSVDRSTVQRGASQDLYASTMSTDKLRTEVELFEKYGRTVKYTEQALAEYETTKGKDKSADAPTKDALVWQGIQRDTLAATRDLVAWKTEHRDALEQLSFETSLIGQGSLEQRIATELRRVDLDVRERSVGLSAEAAQKLREEADIYKNQLTGAIKAADEAQRDFQLGAKAAIDQYVRDTTDGFRTAQDVVQGSARSMEDDFVRFTKTGKLSFKSFADFVIDEFARIQARAVIRPILQAVSGGGSSGGAGGLLGMLGGLFGFGSSATTDGQGMTSYGGTANGLDAAGDFFLEAHTGAIAGVGGGRQRWAPHSVFAGAPRYHTGTGSVGSDEVPAILRRGEGVFTREQMRNMAPVGTAPAAASGAGKVTVNISNQTGQPMEAEASSTFDLDGAVVDIVVRNARQGGQIRDVIKDVTRPPV